MRASTLWGGSFADDRDFGLLSSSSSGENLVHVMGRSGLLNAMAVHQRDQALPRKVLRVQWVEQGEGNPSVTHSISQVAGLGVAIEEDKGGLSSVPIVIIPNHSWAVVGFAAGSIGRVGPIPDIPPSVTGW